MRASVAHVVTAACLCVLAACGGKNVEAPPPVAGPAADSNVAEQDANAALAVDNPNAASNPNAANNPNAADEVPAMDVGQKAARPDALKAFRAGEAAEDPNEALADFAHAASLDPNFYGASYNAGAIAARQGDVQSAERYFNAALKVNRLFGPAAAGLATLYEQQPGGMPRAEQLLRMQLDKKDNAPARAALSELLVRTNRLDEAQREAIAVLHLDERNATAFLTLGMVYRRQHKYELSQLALGQATEVDPASGEAFNEMGLVYLAQKEKAKAVQAFEKAAKATPHVAAIQNNLGVLQTEVGAFKAAVDSLHIATELDPNRAEYNLNLGNALRGDQQYAEAEKSYKQALQAGNKGALFNLGVLYLDNDIPGKDALSRYRDCIGYLQSYTAQVANDPDNGRVSEYLQTAQKAIDTETKRAARDKQRKEKDAAEASKKASAPAAGGSSASGAVNPTAAVPQKPAPTPPPAAAPPAVKAPASTAAAEDADDSKSEPGAKKAKGKHKHKGKRARKRGSQ